MSVTPVFMAEALQPIGNRRDSLAEQGLRRLPRSRLHLGVHAKSKDASPHQQCCVQKH
jgi:hypothetical protein